MSFTKDFWSIPVRLDDDGKSPLDKYTSCILLLQHLYKDLEGDKYFNDSETYGHRIALAALRAEIVALRQRLGKV